MAPTIADGAAREAERAPHFTNSCDFRAEEHRYRTIVGK
jgi:hypothetical protein